MINGCRDVAQFGRVQVWGTWGRWFKSSHPDHGKNLCKSVFAEVFLFLNF